MFYILAGELPFDESNYGPMEKKQLKLGGKYKIVSVIEVDKEPDYSLIQQHNFKHGEEAISLLKNMLVKF